MRSLADAPGQRQPRCNILLPASFPIIFAITFRGSDATPLVLPMNSTFYATSAKYYDGAYAAKADLVDLPFYFDLARKIGGPVLEMGCGTGRVLLPIARAGIE